MLADGLARGGPDEARKRLADFWRAASADGGLPPVQRAVTDRLLSFLPFATAPDAECGSTRCRSFFSPYDVNPLNINPLQRPDRRASVDFDAVRASNLALFISATNVHTGRLRIFPRDKITADVVMASAALPLLFRAVEIDGIPFWDGGYHRQSARSFRSCRQHRRPKTCWWCRSIRRCARPRRARRARFVNRLNEITFNSALISELRSDRTSSTSSSTTAVLQRGTGPDEFRKLNIHRIDLGGLGTRLAGSSKMKTDFDFLELLHRAGQRAARKFPDQHFDAIGYASTPSTWQPKPGSSGPEAFNPLV